MTTERLSVHAAARPSALYAARSEHPSQGIVDIVEAPAKNILMLQVVGVSGDTCCRASSASCTSSCAAFEPTVVHAVQLDE